MTVNEIYQQTIKSLPAADRMQLAKMILNDIPAESFVDYDDSWSDEDLRDFTQASWQRAEEEFGEPEDAQSG
jgi:hypothetical protein